MIRHRCGLWLAAVVIGVTAGLALGQASSAITPEIRTSTNLTPSQVQIIAAAISQDVKALQSDDPLEQQKARDSIVDAVRDQGQVVASSTYKRQYATSLNQALASLPKDAALRTRLNAAIATARVAELSRNSQLDRAAERFLSDEALPVALWGMKAARWILPYEAAGFQFSADNGLLKAIPAAVARHSAGAMYEEAYDALSLEWTNPDVPKPPLESVANVIVPVVQGLIEQRAKLAAEKPIEQPLAETRGTRFLALPEVYRAQSDAARLRTAQVLSDYLSVTAQKAAAGDQGKSVYLDVMRELGSAALVIGQAENSAGIQSAAAAVRELQNSTPPSGVTAAAEALYQALRATPAFSALKPPPGAPASNGGTRGPGVDTVAGG